MDLISLAPSNTEIIYFLGLENYLVANTSLCDFPKEARTLESVGGWSKGIDMNKIVEKDPDLILASDDLQDSIVDELNDKGFNVRQFSPYNMGQVYESIIDISKILGKESKGREIVNEMMKDIENLELDRSVRIYCEEWIDPPFVSGNWVPGLIESIGGTYMIEEGVRSRRVDEKEVKNFDPEFIFVNVCGAGNKPSKEEILDRNGWSEISAISRERVFVLDDSILNRPGPRLVNGAEKICEIINESLEDVS